MPIPPNAAAETRQRMTPECCTPGIVPRQSRRSNDDCCTTIGSIAYLMLDLHRLRLLRELHERGTIAAVAEALRFTPSAVSQQLAVLEAEAGVRLLERAGRGVRLTDPALVLAEH